MKIIDNINSLLGDDLKVSITPKARLKVAASCFSIYAYEALKSELSKIDTLEFIFTAPTFIPNEVTDKLRKEHREFFIPKANRERNLYGSEFEIQLRNKLTQRAIARECAEWIRDKAIFRSNKSKAPMQQFACIIGSQQDFAYMPLHGFTAVDLGYQQGDAVSNIVNRIDEPAFTKTYLQLFDQIWNDPDKVEDVTTSIVDHIASVYQENSPERIYFLMLYNIFSEFLDEIDEDVLPKDLTGYQNSVIWNKLYNFQRDAATGIINKLESYNGCILADSVGLDKTFTALAVIKYYELKNRSVLVLCPKKLADNWLNYNRNLKTNILAKDRLNYDVLCHTDLLRRSGESFGTPLNRVNWENYDLIDKAIPSPILFILSYDNKSRYVAAYKRQSEADKHKWVVSSYFETQWMPDKDRRVPLPVVLDLRALYHSILKAIIPLSARQNEKFSDFINRAEKLKMKEREAAKVEARLIKEKQFNRKVEINAELRYIRSEIERMKAEG